MSDSFLQVIEDPDGFGVGFVSNWRYWLRANCQIESMLVIAPGIKVEILKHNLDTGYKYLVVYRNYEMEKAFFLEPNA